MSYSVQNIRNICLLGHSGSGKTTLAESLLFVTKAIDRMGKTPDGNTTCDYDAEEIKRQISISLAVAPIEYKGVKINVLDVPGAFDFAGEAMEALCAADAAVLVCSAKDGISVGLEKSWKYCETRSMPRFLYISKTDEDNADFAGTLAALREKYGNSIAPVNAPSPDGKVVVDLISNKACEIVKGKRVEKDIPADMAEEAESLRAELMEAAAGTDEELMEKFFDVMELTPEEIAKGMRIGVREGTVVPVLCGSAITGLGSVMFLDNMITMAPNPAEGTPMETEEGTLAVDPSGAPAAFVFKTVADQYGKYSLIKVIRGTITSDLSLYNPRIGSSEKLGRLYTMKGKKTEEIKEISCGDIGAIGKMDRVKTSDTLCAPGSGVEFKPVPFAEPCYSVAISPKTRGQEDKVAQGLYRLNDEDPSFNLSSNLETHQMVLTGAGDIQVDVLVSKLKSRFNVEAELSETRVPYREKIRKTVQKQGRHKKQTGGSGQFGDVWIRFEPNPDEEQMVFEEEVFGGSVPKNFFPAVEKGLREACVHGPLAGYPVVNLKAVLYDGSYHPVDSSEIAFKTAAQLAYKAAMPEANPVLLEPIGELKVTIPDSYMGDVMGDITKRRGRVMGMNPTGDGEQVLEAEVPMAEMSSYAIDLRAMTQSRGSYTFHFIRYEDCPPAAQAKAIEAAKALNEN